MIYRAHFVVPVVEDPIEGGEILVRDGKIVAIGPDVSSSVPDEPVQDFGHAAIIPGFVNAHTHLDYTLLRGRLNDELFPAWIRRMAEFGEQLEYEDFRASAILGALQLARSGVTTIGDSSFFGTAVDAAREVGLRGTVYLEIFGPDPSEDTKDKVEQYAERLEDLRTRAEGSVSIGVSPHAVYTSSERLLRAVAQYAFEEGLPIALHIAETKAESELLISGTGPFAESLRASRFCAWYGRSEEALLPNNIVRSDSWSVSGCLCPVAESLLPVLYAPERGKTSQLEVA